MMPEKLEGNQGDVNCWRINIFVSMEVYKGIGYLFAVKRSSPTSVSQIRNRSHCFPEKRHLNTPKILPQMHVNMK